MVTGGRRKEKVIYHSNGLRSAGRRTGMGTEYESGYPNIKSAGQDFHPRGRRWQPCRGRTGTARRAEGDDAGSKGIRPLDVHHYGLTANNWPTAIFRQEV